MSMDPNRQVVDADKPQMSWLYKAIVGVLVLANVIAGVGLLVRALSSDDSTSVAADGATSTDVGDGDLASADVSADADNTANDTALIEDDADSDAMVGAAADETPGVDDLAAVDPSDVGPSDDSDAADDRAEDAIPIDREPGIDPNTVLESVTFVDTGADAPDRVIDVDELWTGTDLPTTSAVWTLLVVKPEPIAEKDTKYSADFQIHSLTTGELVESTYDRFPDGHLPVFALGDGKVPAVLEDAMTGHPVDSDFLAVYPVGMADMPDTLDSEDAYVAFVRIYRYEGSDGDDAGDADDAGSDDAADGADDAGSDDAADGADDAGSDDGGDPGPNTSDSPDDSDDVEDTEGG